MCNQGFNLFPRHLYYILLINPGIIFTPFTSSPCLFLTENMHQQLLTQAWEGFSGLIKNLPRVCFLQQFQSFCGWISKGQGGGREKGTTMAVQPLAPRWSALVQLLELKLLESLAELSVKWKRVAASSTHLVFLRIWQCVVSKTSQMDKSSTKLVSPKRGWQDPAIRRCSASTFWISGAQSSKQGYHIAMNSQDLSGFIPFSIPFTVVIQELDDSLAEAGQSMQQPHTSWAFMGADVLSSLQKHWCVSIHSCLTVVLLESSLERSYLSLLFPLPRTGNAKRKAGPADRNLLLVTSNNRVLNVT